MFSPDDFKLSFSTWAAPDRALTQLIETAGASGYTGIELFIPGAGAQTEPHAHGVKLDMAATDLASTKQELSGSGIEVSCLATGLFFGWLRFAKLAPPRSPPRWCGWVRPCQGCVRMFSFPPPR